MPSKSCSCTYLQYGKTAKFYVYAPGDLDLNVLVSRCKEMPRKREHHEVRKFSIPPNQQVQQDVFIHSNPPRGQFWEYYHLLVLTKLSAFPVRCPRDVPFKTQG